MKQNQTPLRKHFLIAAGSNYEEKANFVGVGKVDVTQVDQHVDVLPEKRQAQIPVQIIIIKKNLPWK